MNAHFHGHSCAPLSHRGQTRARSPHQSGRRWHHESESETKQKKSFPFSKYATIWKVYHPLDAVLTEKNNNNKKHHISPMVPQLVRAQSAHKDIRIMLILSHTHTHVHPPPPPHTCYKCMHCW